MPFGRIRCFHHVLQLSGAIFVNFLCPTSHVISIHWYNCVNKLGRNFVRFATFAEFAGYVCGRFWNPSSQLISTPSFKLVRRFADSWTDSLYWKNFHRSANPSKLLSLHVITCYCTSTLDNAYMSVPQFVEHCAVKNTLPSIENHRFVCKYNLVFKTKVAYHDKMR